MKRFAFVGAIAALAALVSLSVGPAFAAGIYTPGFPNLPAASITGAETIPADTNYAGGAQPQTASVTSAAIKTYANGGAIVTGAATAGAVTLNGERAIATSEALTTAAGAVYTLTETNSSVVAASLVTCSVGNGTNTQGIPVVSTVVPAAGSVVVKVLNAHASQALNGTITVACRISS